MKERSGNDKKKWHQHLGKEAQEGADKNDSKMLFQIAKEVAGRNSESYRIIPILRKNGELLVAKEAQNERQVEHFKEVLNQPIQNNNSLEVTITLMSLSLTLLR